MARAALTAAILTTMATPAAAHPTFEHYMDTHDPEIGFAPGDPMLLHPFWEIRDREHDFWRHMDNRYDARMRRLEREREAQQQLTLAIPTPTTTGEVESVIRAVFGVYGDQAVAVAICESGLSTTAVNGQFLGIFQMGATERATYGHGDSAYEQAQAAYAYFVASGSDWGPWVCKP